MRTLPQCGVFCDKECAELYKKASQESYAQRATLLQISRNTAEAKAEDEKKKIFLKYKAMKGKKSPVENVDLSEGIGSQDDLIAGAAANRVVRWLERVGNVSVLNVAGTRESHAPTIQEYVKKVMLLVLGEIGRVDDASDHT
jgi:hypothetical protein